MKKPSKTGQIREEYDFSSGERARYAQRYARGTNIVVLAPDVAKVFCTSKANVSLRRLIRAQSPAAAK